MESANTRQYIPREGRIQTMRVPSRSYAASAGATRKDGLPTLNKMPEEIGRERRYCERCAAGTEHIIYRVPKKVLVLYFKNHDKNVHATCKECARSTILSGDERERALSSGQ